MGNTLRILSVVCFSESDGRGLHERKAPKENCGARRDRTVGTFAALVVNLAQARTSPASMVVGIVYGLFMSVAIGGVELFVLDGPMRDWLGGLSFTANLIVRSTIAAIIMIIQFSQSERSSQGCLENICAKFLVGLYLFRSDLGLDGSDFRDRSHRRTAHIPELYHRAISHTGRGKPLRAFRRHCRINRGRRAAQREVGIHRFLDHTFRLLNLSVVDYRGEVLNYVGDRVIVNMARTERCYRLPPAALLHGLMRDELTLASSQLEREFGAAPRIRGSLHFGPVIVGEIGDIKRAIVFNGDVMNTAARQELSRKVEGGFLASRAAIERFQFHAAVRGFAIWDGCHSRTYARDRCRGT